MQALPIAKTLTQEKRKSIAISSLSKTESISGLSASEGVSRKYIYRQKHKAMEALDEKFSDKNDDDVLFNLPVSKSWLKQLMISLVLTCHSSYGGVKELLRDVFDISMSRSTIHNRLQEAAKQAAVINRAQDFSAIRDGLLDEIFQGSTPVLAASTRRPPFVICWRTLSAGTATRGRSICSMPRIKDLRQSASSLMPAPGCGLATKRRMTIRGSVAIRKISKKKPR